MKSEPVLRPWRDEQGECWIRQLNGRTVPYDGDRAFLLRKEVWARIDDAVAEYALYCPVTKYLLSQCRYEFDSPSVAVLREEVTTEPVGEIEHVFELKTLPLPFTHCDFVLDESLVWASAATRRVSERVEHDVIKAILGAEGAVKLPSTREPVADCLRLKEELRKAGYYGPFLVLVPESDAGAVAKLERVDQVVNVVASRDVLSGTTAIVQLTPDVVRIVVGMRLQAVVWKDTLKVMCIVAPQVRCDHAGKTGIGIAQ